MRANERIIVPPETAHLLMRLNRAGFSAYVVGGCVRDSLLGLSPADWDICTSAAPEQTAACFSDCRTVPTGVKYGTVTVLLQDVPYEITTYRAEAAYSDRRHPDAVAFLPTVEGDLARRDFTINAMAADAEGNVLDLFGGRDDLARGLIRCVGKPEERFEEDALRILRALRFAARLGFHVEDATAAAIHAKCGSLEAVAEERLHKELSGLLLGGDAPRLLREFSDVLYVPIPELAAAKGFCQFNPNHRYDVWEHTLAALSASECEEILRLAVLLHDVGKPSSFSMDKNAVGHFYGHAVVGAAMTERILRRLRYDGETVRLVTTLVRSHDRPLPETPKAARRLLALLGQEGACRFLRLRRADLMGKGTMTSAQIEQSTLKAEQLVREEQRSCFDLQGLAIDGNVLLALGVPKGPEIGRLLKRLLQAVVEEELPNEPQELIQYAQKIREWHKLN